MVSLPLCTLSFKRVFYDIHKKRKLRTSGGQLVVIFEQHGTSILLQVTQQERSLTPLLSVIKLFTSFHHSVLILFLVCVSSDTKSQSQSSCSHAMAGCRDLAVAMATSTWRALVWPKSQIGLILF